MLDIPASSSCLATLLGFLFPFLSAILLAAALQVALAILAWVHTILAWVHTILAWVHTILAAVLARVEGALQEGAHTRAWTLGIHVADETVDQQQGNQYSVHDEGASAIELQG